MSIDRQPVLAPTGVHEVGAPLERGSPDANEPEGRQEERPLRAGRGTPPWITHSSTSSSPCPWGGPTGTEGRQSFDQLEHLQQRREQVLGLAERRGIGNIRVFGSLAREEADNSSDLDLLVDLAPGRGLVALGGFAEELASLLGMRVDVATVPELKPRIRDLVLAEAVPL